MLMSWYAVAMSGKAAAEKRFDRILRRMLQSKPLSRSEINAMIQARRKAGKTEKPGFFACRADAAKHFSVLG
jgi:hypothetical protein